MEQNRTLEQQIKEAERAVAQAEQELGPDHPDLADKLTRYASLLRQTNIRVLDAVNVEARAKAIRAKIYANEAEKQKTVELKQLSKAQKSPWMYIGLVAVFGAVASLFIDQTYFQMMALMVSVLAIADIVMSKGQWWRAGIAAGFLLWGWWGINSIPEELIIHATPLDRLNYEVSNPLLVSHVKALGPDAAVFGHQLRVPTGLEGPEEQETDWGRVKIWKGGPRVDQTSPTFAVMKMSIPEDDESKKATLQGLCANLVVPRVEEFAGFHGINHDTGEPIEINGTEFVLMHWSGEEVQNAGQIRGFVYVCKESSGLLVISGWDSMAFADENLPRFDSAAHTFRLN